MIRSLLFLRTARISRLVNLRFPFFFRNLVIYILITSMLSTSLTVAGATIAGRDLTTNSRNAISPSPSTAARPRPVPQQANTGTRDSRGTDFWLTFPANGSGGANNRLLISGDVNTTGTVEVTSLSYFATFSVTSGSSTTIDLPAGTNPGQLIDAVQSLGVHVSAQDRVSVYAFSQTESASDGYLGLPTEMLGTEYIVSSYKNNNGGSEFGIVAAGASTTVTITPSDGIGNHSAFVPFSVLLQQGQTYQLRKDDGGDLTGTIVTSDKPIAVVSAHRCAAVTDGNTPCGFLAEALSPVTNWGTNFLTLPFATRQNGDVVRILSAQDGTAISINGVSVATVDRAQYYEQVVTGPSVITADHPILVSQYSTSSSFDGQTGNAEMMLISPTDRFLSSYTIAMPSSGFTVNYLNVVAPTSAIGGMTLDGTAIPAGSFAQIGSSDFSGAQISVTGASHSLSGPVSFGVYAYGFGNTGGYAYPAGMSLPLVPAPSATTLTLNPATASSHVNNQSCVTATVTDDLNFPMTGVSVAFNITGANPNGGSALSDGNGRAQFCYAGSASGQDTIHATTGNLSATAVKTWIKANAVTLSPKNAVHPVGTTRCVVATALNPNNSPSVGASLSFTVTGANATSGTSQTDINGQGTFCYAGNNAGSDIVTVTTDGASDTANVTWGNTTIQPPPPSINLVVVNHAPSINGHIDGSIQQLLGESVNLNSGANITNDLMVPGTPNVQINGSPTYGGTTNGTGSSSPTGYSITINSGATLGHVVRKTNPITMNPVSAPPGPSGTRDVTINSPGQSAGNFATLRNLTMNSNAGQITVPPGTYGAFTANSQSGFTFGVAGSTQPTVYNLQQLTLNSNSQLQLLGPIVLNLAGNVTINSGVTMGSSSNTSWLSLLIAQNGLTINSAGSLFADVQAPTSTVNINGVLSGSLTCDRLTMNSGSVLKAVGSAATNQTPQVNAGNGQTISLPANSVTLSGNATDDGLPVGSSLTYSWTKVSGPGTVTFANSAAASTTATFGASGQYVLQLSASDSQLTGSDTIVITVNPINQAPVVNAGFAQTIELPAAALLRGTVADDGLPAGSTVTSSWAMVSGPGIVTYSSPSSETTSAKFSDPGTYVLRLSASDSQLTGSADVTITVNPANQTPVVNAGANQVIELPTNTANLTGSATDDGFPVGSTLSYSWSRFSGPSPVTFANSHAAATTATFATVGTYVLRLSVSDGKLTGTSNVTIIVTPANKPPVVTAGQNQTIELPTNTVNLNGTVTDDGLPLGATVTSTWSVVSGPGTVVFGNPSQPTTTALFGNSAGTYVLRLAASDTKLTGSADVTITVLPANQAPVVNAGANQTIILPNNIANLNGTVTDDGFPQGGTLTTSWSKVSGPGEVVFANPAQRTTTATFSAEGVYVLRLTANDSQLSASSDVTITVVHANQAPTVSAGPNQIITQPANTVTLNGSATDDGLPTGSHVTVTWSTVSGPGPVVFASPNQTVTTATVTAVGAYVLRLTASDSALTSSSDVTITVQAANQAPIVNAGANQTVSLPNSAQLNGIVTDDGLPVASHLTFAWSMVSGPGSVVFTAPTQPATVASFGVAGQYVLRLTASDSQLSTSGDVTITVTPANQPPTVNAGQSQTIVLPNNTASLNGSATDDGLPIGGSLSYTWSTVSGPTSVFFLNPHSATTQAAINTVGTYVLRLTASDGALSASADVTIIVKSSNRAPVIASQPVTNVTLQPSSSSTLLSEVNWSAIAYDFQPAGAANWLFLNQGKTDVMQLNNSDPSFLLSDFTLGTDHIEGTLRVNTVNDDDFVGFVFGFQDRGHFYLFDWKKADQFGGSSFGEQGMTLKVVNIDPSLIPDLWATYVGNDTVRTLYHVRVPWVEFEEYNYTLDYAPGQFTITVKNAGTGVVLASFTIDDNTYTGGKFGFYNYSQESVIYRSTRRSTLAQGLYQYNVIATDPDLDLLSFSLPTAPAGMTVDQSTGTITWPVTVADIGPHPVSVKTQDPAGLSATQSFTVTVDGSTIPLNVSAGQNQTVALPSAATLSGSAIDSSFPYGGPVSFLWSVVSGPGTVTFTNASQAVTTANFSDTGVYVLRLSANNSVLSGTADVTITVIPRQNAAPIVSAGPNQILAAPSMTTTLNGIVTDDGMPTNSTVSVQWQSVTAPGTVVFTTPNATTTNVTFGAAGIYILRLSASDGQLSASSDITIFVSSSCLQKPSGLVGWWPADGNVNDYVSANNGLLFGGASFVNGIAGQAFKLDGTGYVQIPDTPALKPSQQVSVDAWVKFDSLESPNASLAGLQYIIFKKNSRVGNFEGYALYKQRMAANDDRFVFRVTDVNGLTSSTQSSTHIAAGQWYHVVATYDTSHGRVYVNGVLEGEFAGTLQLDYGTRPIFIGSSGESYFDGKLNGEVDEAHIFNRAITPAEVQSIYISNNSGFCRVGINTPPVVSAGPDQTISQPVNTAQLAGTATDDGLPTGSVLAINWTTVSGPGPVAFSNPNSAATSATFNVPGTYVLRLSASDGVFTSNSDVTVKFTPPCQPPPNGLIGWWRGENDANDAIGVNNGHIFGGVTYSPGIAGQAFLFDGSTGSVQIPDAPELKPARLTFDAWVRFDSLDSPGTNGTGLQYIVFKRGNGPFEAFSMIKLRPDGADRFLFIIGSDPSLNTRVSVTSTTAIVAGQTYHVAGTYDGSQIKLYVNGALEASLSVSFNLGYLSGKPLILGSTGESFDGKITGLVDEVHLFNRALSGSEIQGIYQSNTAGICTTQTNRSPVVNAGPDLTIALPNNIAAVNGTATDDGLPVGNTLAVSWSKVSGPGNAFFLSPNAAATSATFDLPGTYVLRLTASDGALTSFDDVTVTLLPSNQPPSVSAGSPQTIGYTPNLLVNASNEAPLVNSLIPNWNVVSGTWTQAVVGQNGLPAAFDGSTYFFAGQSPTAELSQDIDISAYAGTIALGLQRFEFIGYGRTLNENPADTVRVVLEYRNAANTNVLSTLDTGQITPIHDWAVLHTVSFAPAGSARIRVRLIATRNNGTRNDAVFDGLSLRPVNSAATNLSGTATDDGLPTGSTVGISWTKISGPGAVTFFNPNSPATVATFGAPGSYVLRLSASDSLLTGSSDVTITVTSGNQPPVVNAGADQAITFPNPASLNGSVSDDGLPTGNTVTVSWSQVSGPGTVTFADSHNPLTTASFSGIGVYVLRLSASDGESSGSADTVITVNAANLAPSVNAGANQTITLPVNQITLSGSATDDGLPMGSGLTFAWSQLNGPSLVSFADQHAPVTTATFTAPGTYQLRLSATDGELIGSADVTITVNHANQAPVVNAGSAQTITMPSSAQLLGVVTDDGLPTGAQLSYNWSQVSGPGFAAFTAPTQLATAVTFAVPGVYVLRLSASDTLLTGSGTVTITVNPEAGAPPTVSINSPADAADITKRTDVIGTVSFGQPGGTWMLEYSLNTADGGPSQVWKTFATGSGSVDNATLGTFDPTVLLNGTYSIRLTAVDTSNRFGTITTSVIVSRNQKVGNFTVSFNDLSLPLPGLPIQVVRTYDSRDKRQGDFGAGWTLSLTNIRISKTGILGEHWEEDTTGGLLPTYTLQSTKPRVVTIVFPDGKVYKFQVTPSPASQRLGPITGGTIGFTQLPGATGTAGATLEVVGGSDFLVAGSVPGLVDLIDIATQGQFNPTRFKLTVAEGYSYVIDQTLGVQSVTDPNGNTLTINANGITHSNGESVAFTRDALGRITRISDLAGHPMIYNYDGNGDLVSVTDRENNTTTFTYDSNHYLLTITDPRGITPLRNEFDADGRLINQTDAFGKVIGYQHDLPNNRETITDRLGHVTIHEYDDDGNVVKTTDAKGGVTTYTFDADDNQLSMTNALGNTTAYTYDTESDKLTETDPLHHTVTYTYNNRRQVLTVTDPRGGVTTNTYDNNGNLLTTKDGMGNVTANTYNQANGQLLTTTDPLSGITNLAYDIRGNLSTQTDPLGDITTFQYDSNNNRAAQIVTRTAPGGIVETITTNFQYDNLNRLTKTTYADNSTSQVVYTSLGQPAATIDQLGHQTSFTYDDAGRLTKTTYPDNTFKGSTYDVEGHLITSTDRAGRVTKFTYDELGRLTKTTFVDSTFTTTTYDAIGKPVAVTDADGNTTQYSYDAGGHRTKLTDAVNDVITFAYDANGNQISFTDANGHTTNSEYDAQNRQTRVTYADGTTQVTVYDGVGRATSKSDQAGKVTQFSYDGDDRIIRVTDTLGQITSYSYDELGQQLTQTDANGHTTKYEYDRLGRRTKQILPLGMFQTYSYDTAGRLQGRTDYNGKSTTYAYDSMNRLMSKTPDASLNQPTINFTYTATGQRATMTDASGMTTYTYDNRNRLTIATTPEGTLHYSYDAAGNLRTTSSTNENGVSTIYTYDVLNRLATVTDNARGTRAQTGTTTNNYDAAGNLASYLYPNGALTTYTYDRLNRLTNMSVIGPQNSTLASYAYTLGPAGNKISMTEHNGRTVNYSYDDMYRLTNETITNDPNASSNGSIVYVFDSVGNRLSRTSTLAAIANQSSTYDANDRLTSYGFDSNGSTKVSGGNEYSYDFENRLTSLNNGAVTYLYDGNGSRVAKTVNGVTTKYLIDTNNPTGYAQVAEEIVGGMVQRVYVYGNSRISQTQLIDGNWTATFYGYDGQGNVRFLTDITGTITDTYEYDAFGNILYRSGSTPNDFLYSGEAFDANLGLYYLRARYLDSSSARFWTMDPFEGSNTDPITLHKYLYANGNPVNASDPTGYVAVGTAEALAGTQLGQIINAVANLILLDILWGIKKTIDYEIDKEERSRYLFRGDNEYRGGPIGLPINGAEAWQADVQHPWEHVRKGPNDTSIYTSFSHSRLIARKFGTVYKAALAELLAVESTGTIIIITSDLVYLSMLSIPKLAKDAPNVKQIMDKNQEVLIEGQIPAGILRRAN